MTEAAGGNGSIVTVYQYEKNTHSDSQFMKDCLEKEKNHAEPVTIVADGAYSGSANEGLAAEKNVKLVATNLTGREAEDSAADFEFDEEGTKVENVPVGLNPEAAAIIPGQASARLPSARASADSVRIKASAAPNSSNVSAGRPYPQTRSGVPNSRDTVGWKNSKNFHIFRNGVEAILSILRRKYHIDHMPVRDLVRSRQFFGCKIGALNFGKFCRCMQGCANYTPNIVMA